MSTEKPRCRLCMYHKPYLATLFRRSLSMKVMELADVEVMENDGLPTVVCIDCENAVEKCYSFRTQIQLADKKFREEMSVSLVEVEECNIKEEHGDFMEDDSDLHSDSGHNDGAAETEDTGESGEKGQDEPVIPLDHVEVMETIESGGSQVQMIDDPQGQAEPLIEAPFAAKEEERAMDPLICTKEEDVSMEGDTNSATPAPASTSSFPVKWKKPARPCSTSAAKTKPKKIDPMRSLQVHEELTKLRRTLIAPPNKGFPFGQKKQELVSNIDGSVLHNTDSRRRRNKCGCKKNKNTLSTHRSILKDATHSNVDKRELYVPKRKIVNTAISGAFCMICNVECGSLGLLKEHLQQKELICRLCTKKFNSHKALENHYFTHKKYSCLVCNESFFNKKELFMHRTALNHSGYQQECKMCGKKVLSQNSVPKPRTQLHNKSGITYLKCVVCAKEFALASSLSDHLQSCHTVYERVECTMCQKLLNGPEKLIAHIKASHMDGDKDLRSACAVCGKKFSNNEKLKKHVDTHICRICGISIKGKTAMEKHMHSTHPQRTKCMYKRCNQEFDSVLALSQHSKKVHTNASAPLSETDCCCEICGKTFKTSAILKAFYSDEKPFKCNMCVVKFQHHFMTRSIKRAHSCLNR